MIVGGGLVAIGNLVSVPKPLPQVRSQPTYFHYIAGVKVFVFMCMIINGLNWIVDVFHA
jgi:hypothetical protein